MRTKGISKVESPFEELGVAGVKLSNGFVYDEYLTKLIGDKGRKIYREMRDNDAIVSAILFAVEMLLRAVDWRVESDEELDKDKLEDASYEGVPKTPEEAVKWLEGCFLKDMSHTFDEFISIILSMLQYGWQYTEVVYKRRLGPDQIDSSHRSEYDDGLIGIRKLVDRSQETLDKWEVDESGGVVGMWQQPPLGGIRRFIPIDKALLFRPHPFKGSPEGRSVLRAAYRSWYFLKNLQEIEAIAIERELNGLPVVYIPNEILNGDSTDQKKATEQYKKMVRDIKFNEQGGVVLPSNLYQDADGKLSAQRMVTLELLNAGGTRAIDIGKTIIRYQQDIARTILADFIMLGSGDKGSFALSKDKSKMFTRALSGWLTSIATTMNRHLVPKVWALNNFDRAIMPHLVPGNIEPVDLEQLSTFIERLSRAGAPLFPDDGLENELRELGGLPEKTGEEGLENAGLVYPPPPQPLPGEPVPPEKELKKFEKQGDGNPFRMKAQNVLNRAVANGTIVKPSICVRCKKSFNPTQLQAHHLDYTKPLEVDWYCQSCHGFVGHGKKTNTLEVL